MPQSQCVPVYIGQRSVCVCVCIDEMQMPLLPIGKRSKSFAFDSCHLPEPSHRVTYPPAPQAFPTSGLAHYGVRLSQTDPNYTAQSDRQDEAGADDKLLYNGPALRANDNGKRVVMTPDFLPIVFL